MSSLFLVSTDRVAVVPGLSLLSCKLFEGLSDEELQLMETGLMVSCHFGIKSFCGLLVRSQHLSQSGLLLESTAHYGRLQGQLPARCWWSEGWLLQSLLLLSCKLFEGLSDEELELMETGLMVSCHCES
jgi:DNA-binding MarR family transcriptional regulator